MANNMVGRILNIGQTLNTPSKDGLKTYSSRMLVLDCTTTNSSGQIFENTPQFEFEGNLCQELDKFTQGQIVQVTFELRGIKYTSKTTGQPGIFNKIRPYKIDLYQAGYGNAIATPQQPAQQPAFPPQQPNYQQPQGFQPQGFQGAYPPPAQPNFPPQGRKEELPF
jgi:hypothetical protein